MRPIVLLVFGSLAITLAVEWLGLGVFAANRRYDEQIEQYQKQNRYADAPPSVLDALYRKQFGSGVGVLAGVYHGALGIPRTFLFFGMVAAQRNVAPSLYLASEPIFAHHNNGEPYLAGFIIGVLAFVTLLARALPFRRPEIDEEADEPHPV